MHTTKSPVSQRRVRKLLAEIKRVGTQAEFSRKHGIDVTYLSQLVGGHRAFGEKAARNMESKCGWPQSYLDQEDIDADIANVQSLVARLTPEQARAIVPVLESLLRPAA